MKKFASTIMVMVMVVFFTGTAALFASANESTLAGVEAKLKKTLEKYGMSEDTITEVLNEVKPQLTEVIVPGGIFLNAGNNNLSGIKGTENAYNTFYGQYAGAGITSGSGNSFYGVEAGYNTASGSSNTFFGHQAGYSNTTGNGNLFLGYNAGLNELGSNRLFIANSNTTDPLIYGEFDNNIVAVNGKLGVGTKSPDYTMEVETNGENAVVMAHRIDGGDEKSFISASLNYGNIGTASDHPLRIFTNSTWKMRLETNGNLVMADGGSYDGTWNPACSRELKENIVDLSIEEAIEAVKSLEPVKYNYKNSKEEARVGFIAEDVPELVATNSRKNLSTLDIIAVLTKVVQDMQKRDLDRQKIIADLSKRYQDKQKTISELNKRISELEKK